MYDSAVYLPCVCPVCDMLRTESESVTVNDDGNDDADASAAHQQEAAVHAAALAEAELAKEALEGKIASLEQELQGITGVKDEIASACEAASIRATQAEDKVRLTVLLCLLHLT